MKVEILRCPKCLAYTLNSLCRQCNSKTLSPKPPKFSIEDRWGKYRRIAKKELINIF